MVLSKYELGKLVKEARKIKTEKIGKKYTQIMLASDINKSQGYIGDIESGRSYPTFKVLSKIAEACEVPFSFFDNTKIDALKKIIINTYPDMPDKKVQEISNHMLAQLKTDKDNSFIDIDRDLDLNFIKSKYDSFKERLKLYDYIEDDNYENFQISQEISNYDSVENSKNLDVKSAMDSILSQPGLMLNGQILSDDSKIALANAIQLGLQYAEQMQKKDNEKDNS